MDTTLPFDNVVVARLLQKSIAGNDVLFDLQLGRYDLGRDPEMADMVIDHQVRFFKCKL